MQLGLARQLDATCRAATGPMTVDEFLARFPEVPGELRDEPVLAGYVEAFAPLLRRAQKPTPCMGRDGGDAEHQFYAKLVNDLAIYGIGLARRDRTLARLAALIDQQRKQPTFACTLVPPRPRGTPRSGCT